MSETQSWQQQPQAEEQSRPRLQYPMNEQQFEAACDYLFPNKVPLTIAISGIKNMPAYIKRLAIVNPIKAFRVLAQIEAMSPVTAKLIFIWASKAVDSANINISSLMSPQMGGGLLETIPTNLRSGDRKPSVAPVQPYESRSLAGSGEGGGNRQ